MHDVIAREYRKNKISTQEKEIKKVKISNCVVLYQNMEHREPGTFSGDLFSGEVQGFSGVGM